MIQVRNFCFETNSSSTHSLVVCSKKDLEAWRAGKVVRDMRNNSFVEFVISPVEIENKAEELYNYDKQKFWKDWSCLSDEEKYDYILRAKREKESDAMNGSRLAYELFEEFVDDYWSDVEVVNFKDSNGTEMAAISSYTHEH